MTTVSSDFVTHPNIVLPPGLSGLDSTTQIEALLELSSPAPSSWSQLITGISWHPGKHGYAAYFQAMKQGKKFDPELHQVGAPSLATWSETEVTPDQYYTNLARLVNLSIEDIKRDIYIYPLNPQMNMAKCARLVLSLFAPELPQQVEMDDPRYHTFVKDIEDNELRPILPDRLQVVDFDMYNAYELFFLCTRGYTRPWTDSQLSLAMRRLEYKGASGARQRQFIDQVFYSETLTMSTVASVLYNWNRIKSPDHMDTPYDDWVKWAPDYLAHRKGGWISVNSINTQGFPHDNQILEQLTRVSDRQLLAWARLQPEEAPSRQDAINRLDWIRGLYYRYLIKK